MTSSADDTPDAARDGAPEGHVPQRAPARLQMADSILSRVETVFYLIVALFLVVAGVVVVVGTVRDFVESIESGQSFLMVALTLIEEALLLVIVAELLITLRLVLQGQQLSAEPFLLIGLVATVRRVVVLTAELEAGASTGEELTNLLLELAVLAGLIVSFAVAFYLLRKRRLSDPE